MLSNGTETKIGSTFAPWEYFVEWKRIATEEEKPTISLEKAIRGTCEREKFLDIIANFIVYEELRGTPIKILSKNHLTAYSALYLAVMQLNNM